MAHNKIDEKMVSKSKQNKTSLTHLYKWKFVYWKPEKWKIGIFTAKLTILCYDQLHTSLERNGNTAIPKMFSSWKKYVFSLEIVIIVNLEPKQEDLVDVWKTPGNTDLKEPCYF